MNKNNLYKVRLEIKNQKIRKEFEEIISSSEGFFIQQPEDQSAFDLLIMEVGDNLKKELQLINSIKSSGDVKEIFLTSQSTDPNLLIQVPRMGIKEFFPQPVNKEEVKNSLSSFKDRQDNLKYNQVIEKKGKIINLMGSKGGVGTTTIAVNLAASLNEVEDVRSVALVDMNLVFGDIVFFLNIEPVFDWGDVAKNISRMDTSYLRDVLFKHSSGIYVLPSPRALDGINVVSSEIMERLLSMMQTMFDFIVVDSGQSLDEISLKIIEMSDTTLMISLLTLPCLAHVKRLYGIFQKLIYQSEEKIKVVVNCYCKKSEISLKDAEDTINKKIFWHIPNDCATTMGAINRGTTLSDIARKAEITKNLRELASSFLEKKETGKKGNGLLSWRPATLWGK